MVDEEGKRVAVNEKGEKYRSWYTMENVEETDPGGSFEDRARTSVMDPAIGFEALSNEERGEVVAYWIVSVRLITTVCCRRHTASVT